MINGYLSKSVLAGMVVLYNPESSVINNIASYIVHVDHLYIIDNSECPDSELLKSIFKISNNISYHCCNENLGIATALNLGCNFAINAGYKWILTMDQDSLFDNTDFFTCVFNKFYIDTAIIAASYNSVFLNPRPSIFKDFLEVDFVITSGNILNLDAWKLLSGFVEKLFIDEVDNEFCIRAKNKRLKVLTTTNICLIHNLGDELIVKRNFTGKSSTLTKHSPLRVYYMVRNNFYIWRKFLFSNTRFVFNRIVNMILLILKIQLHFSNKLTYIRYILKAIKDSYNGNYGKLGK